MAESHSVGHSQSPFGRGRLGLIVVGITLNLGIWFVVSTLKLPFYLDSIGTLLATTLGGLWVGITVGIISVLIGSLFVAKLWAYILTAVAIAAYTNITMKVGFLRRIVPTILWGLGLGIVSASFSAPISAYVWKGVKLAGSDGVTAFILATGRTILEYIDLGAAVNEPIDKLVTALIVFAFLRRIPSSMKLRSDAP